MKEFKADTTLSCLLFDGTFSTLEQKVGIVRLVSPKARTL